MIRLLSFLSVAVMGLSGCMTDRAPSTQPETYAYTPINFKGPIATSNERAQCEAVGGIIQRAGLAGFERCTQSLPDGFKTCSDSDECLARCVLNLPGEVPPGTPATGICAMTDNPFGCTTHVENGHVEPGLCVD